MEVLDRQRRREKTETPRFFGGDPPVALLHPAVKGDLFLLKTVFHPGDSFPPVPSDGAAQTFLNVGHVEEKRQFRKCARRRPRIEAVDHLISNWPDEIDDSAARRDWGWRPAHDFESSAEQMIRLLQAT